MLQLKQQLSKMSERQRQEVAGFLHRLKQDSPAWRKEMSRRMAEMDAGKNSSCQKLSQEPEMAGYAYEPR